MSDEIYYLVQNSEGEKGSEIGTLNIFSCRPMRFEVFKAVKM
jgi:hypothetical protein